MSAKTVFFKTVLPAAAEIATSIAIGVITDRVSEKVSGSFKKDFRKSPRETGGPVVRTGPTAGQNRSRNSDGTWRRKNSSAGKPRK
jgi:hypothetical protein